FVIAAGALFAAPFTCMAQQQGKVWRIGFLMGFRRPASLDANEYFRATLQGLRDLGYVEGKNSVFEWRFAENRRELLPALAVELVKLNVDVIFSVGTPATLAAQKATTTIPIVFAAGDPVGAGLIASLARPGGNTTGVSSLDVDLSPKLLELLLIVVPKASKVAVIVNPDNSAQYRTLKLVQDAAQRVGRSVLALEPRTAVEIENAFSTMAQQGAGAVLVAPDSLLFASLRREIAELAAKNRFPSIGGDTQFAEAGGLLSYSANSRDLWRRQVIYVDQVLKGAKPGDLPVEQPTTFDLVINLKTAKALGLTIPQSVLLRANRVIE
ncbi:MAG: ABC transporter substrate-binding protein, partial [Burkholderiales bacterium]